MAYDVITADVRREYSEFQNIWNTVARRLNTRVRDMITLLAAHAGPENCQYMIPIADIEPANISTETMISPANQGFDSSKPVSPPPTHLSFHYDIQQLTK